MEKVKPGYKRTEIGIIPNDWKIAIISEIGKVYSGGTPDTTNPNYWDGDIFWCTPTDITALKNQKYLYDTGRKITGLGLKYSSSKLLPPNSVIVCTRATIGKAAINKIPMTTNQGFKNIIPENINPDLLYYIICNNTDRLIKLANGSTFLEVSKNGFDNFQIAVPILKKEQDAIASALSDVDSLIDESFKLLNKKRLIKEGAMQRLFSPKSEWEEVTLESLTKIFTKQTGFDYTSNIKPYLLNKKDDQSIPFIQNKDFKNKWTNYNTDYYIPIDVAYKFPKILLNEKCLLISISGSIGNVGIFSNKQIAFIGGAVAVLKFKDTNYLEWIMYYLRSEEGQNQIFGNVKSGSHQNLILDDIRKIKIPLPSIKDQERITSLLSDMDDEIEVLEQNLSKYKVIKEGMMQQLLTGKIRLM